MNAEDVMTEIARLCDHIDADHLVMVQLGILANTAVEECARARQHGHR